ncbi:MAG: nucleoside deaminase [Gammaproteobacteria bacterium]|nr:MAG: nucleoside deaminase [Gammaproteobacteria bacterium]
MRPVLQAVFIGARMSNEQHEGFMRAALEAARRGMLAGEPPVGACLVVNGEIVATLSNAVIGELDITAHAEMRVIREACRQLRRLDLSGCTLYVTVEPCLMCQAACHYAGITEIIYGAAIDDMQVVTGNELDVNTPVSASLALEGGCLAAESRALITSWSEGNRAS